MELCGVCEICLPPYTEIPECLNFPVGFSVCAETVLRGLGRAVANETNIAFTITNISMSYVNSNPECNSETAQGNSFLADKFTIAQEITKQLVEKNGTATISDLCFDYEFFQDLVLPNQWWFNCFLDLYSFDVEFVLTYSGEPAHVIRATCTPSAECDPTCDPNERTDDPCQQYLGVDLNCEKTCDSKTGNPAYCE
jgi:hypothetical protein